MIDYKTPRFEELAGDVDVVFDAVGGETRERSLKLLKKGVVRVTTLTEPDRQVAAQYGVRALRFTVEAGRQNNGRDSPHGG